MSKKIILVTDKDVKATGLPAGAGIDYDAAPAYMQRRYDSLHAPLSAETAARLQAKHDAAVEFAERTRAHYSKEA